MGRCVSGHGGALIGIVGAHPPLLVGSMGPFWVCLWGDSFASFTPHVHSHLPAVSIYGAVRLFSNWEIQWGGVIAISTSSCEIQWGAIPNLRTSQV